MAVGEVDGGAWDDHAAPGVDTWMPHSIVRLEMVNQRVEHR